MRNRQFRNQDTCWHQFLDVRTPKILLRDSSTFQVALSIPTLVAYYELYVEEELQFGPTTCGECRSWWSRRYPLRQILYVESPCER